MTGTMPSATGEGWATMLRRTAAAYPDRTAVVLDDARLSYAWLVAAGEDRARQLAALGLIRGDRVALILPNGVEFVSLLTGAAMAGIVVVPVNIRFRAHELRHILTDSGVAAVFTTSALDNHVNFKELLAETLPDAATAADRWALHRPSCPALRVVVNFGAGTAAGWSMPRRWPPAPTASGPRNPRRASGAEDLQLILYTSGTTAAPKGCLLPNRCLVATAGAVRDLFAIGPDDVWWCPLPMFHIGGILFMSVCLAAGARFVGTARFDWPAPSASSKPSGRRCSIRCSRRSSCR